MNRPVWCVGCMVWVAVVWQLSSAKTCADLEFLNSNVTGSIKVEENDYAKLVFHLNTSACQNSSEKFLIKVSYEHNGLPVGVCNLILEENMCNTTDSTEACKCLQHNKNIVRFYKKMNSSYPAVYTWTWIRIADRSEDNKKIVFEVLTIRTSTVAESQTARHEVYKTAVHETETTTAPSLASEGRTDEDIDDGTLHTSPAVRTERTNVTTRTTPLHTNSPRNIADVNLNVVVIQSVMSAVGTGIPIAIVIVIVVVVYRRRKGRLRGVITQRRLVTSELRFTRLFNRATSRDQNPIPCPRPNHTLPTPQRPLSANSMSAMYVEISDDTVSIKDLKLYETPGCSDEQGETTYTSLEQKDSLEQKKEKSKNRNNNQTIMSKKSYNSSTSSSSEPKPGCSKTSDFLDQYVKRA